MKEKKSNEMKSGWRSFTRKTFFQAKDRDDMMSWIEIIQKNNNPDEDVSLPFKTFKFQLIHALHEGKCVLMPGSESSFPDLLRLPLSRRPMFLSVDISLQSPKTDLSTASIQDAKIGDHD